MATVGSLAAGSHHKALFPAAVVCICVGVFASYPFIHTPDCFSEHSDDEGALQAGERLGRVLGLKPLGFYVSACGLTVAVVALFFLFASRRLQVGYSLSARTCLLGGCTSFFLTSLLSALERLLFHGRAVEAELQRRTGIYGARVCMHAVIEEGAKICALSLHAPRQANHGQATSLELHSRGRVQFLALAGCVGLGFQLIENFYFFTRFTYFAAQDGDADADSLALWIAPAVQRSLDGLHPVATCLAAQTLWQGRKRGRAACMRLAQGLGAASVLHAAFNLAWGFLQPPWSYLAAFAPVLAVLLYLCVRADDDRSVFCVPIKCCP